MGQTEEKRTKVEENRLGIENLIFIFENNKLVHVDLLNSS